MRSLTAGLLVACMGVASMTSARAQWTEAKIPGEQHRTAQGCAGESRRSGDWVCIFVRCDQSGSPPGLHFSTPGPDIQGNIKLTIDDESFALSVPAFPSPLAMSTRAEALPGDLIEAMKAGSVLSIEGTDLKPPYNRISLQNSRNAIERVEQACARSHPGATGLWRRIMRRVAFF
jgi:hypothetical protein